MKIPKKDINCTEVSSRTVSSRYPSKKGDFYFCIQMLVLEKKISSSANVIFILPAV